jgi:hypothetical protein
LEPVQELITDKPDDFQRSRWTVWLRQGLLEQLFGDAAQGEALLAQARAASPFAEAFLFFAHVAYRVYARSGRTDSPFLPELRADLGREASTTRAALLVRLYFYWERAPDKPALGAEVQWMRKYLQAAAKGGCTRAEAKVLVELCGPGDLREQAQAFVKLVLRQDPEDPMFRTFEVMLHPTYEFNPGAMRPKLESILEEARRRGDQETIQRVQSMLRTLERARPMPMPPEFYDDEDEDEEEEELDLAPDGLEGFGDIFETLTHASDAEIREMRRTLPKSIPTFIFDLLVEAAKGGLPFPLPKPSRRSQPPLPPGSRQKELF